LTLPEARTAPAPPPAAFTGGGRDRYLDLLRALALVRVVTFHTFGWAWLTFVFPSIGVMFALAGSLMARSLTRPAATVLRGRIRRLLPPFWLFGAGVVAAMLIQGWRVSPLRLLLWVFPVLDPPGANADWVWEVNGPLWYIRTYLWLVLLSPLLLRAFRRAPWALIAAFPVLTVVLQYGLLPGPDLLLSALTDVAVFGACWLLGFAHRDGLLDAIRARVVVAVAVVCLAAGGWFAYTHPTAEGYDLGEIPLGQALWSFGFVLLLMRFRPRLTRRVPVLDGAVGLLNARAVTVYLWHEIALVASVPLIDLMWNVPAFEKYLPLDATWFQYLLLWPLIAIAILLVGWAEDLAARRVPHPWPTGRPPGAARGRRRAAAGRDGGDRGDRGKGDTPGPGGGQDPAGSGVRISA
jgi:peptidoglycan/LPS O-acetylase OafA/YrhL